MDGTLETSAVAEAEGASGGFAVKLSGKRTENSSDEQRVCHVQRAYIVSVLRAVPFRGSRILVGYPFFVALSVFKQTICWKGKFLC